MVSEANAVVGLLVVIINLFLSAISVKAYRCNWDPEVPLPEVEGATYFHKKWKARPLFRVGKNIVRGVKVGKRVMLEADSPITFNFSEE